MKRSASAPVRETLSPVSLPAPISIATFGPYRQPRRKANQRVPNELRLPPHSESLSNLVRLNAWLHYRQALAEWLPQDQWSSLRTAMRHLQTMDRVHKMGASNRPFSPNDVAHLQELKIAMNSANEMLASYD